MRWCSPSWLSSSRRSSRSSITILVRVALPDGTARPGRFTCRCQRGSRFSVKARTPSAKSSERNAASRSACSSATSASSSGGSSARSTRLLPRTRQRRERRDLGGQRDSVIGDVVDDLVHQAPGQRRVRRDRARGQEQLAGAGGADRVDEPPQPGVRVDDAEPRRRHPELRARRAHAQVAGERELQPAAERVPAHRGHDRHLDGVHRRQRRLERVREQLRRLLGEAAPATQIADVVAGREDGPGAGDDDAARVELRQGRGQALEDRPVERVALGRVVDRDARNALGGRVDGDRACHVPHDMRVREASALQRRTVELAEASPSGRCDLDRRSTNYGHGVDRETVV